MKLLSGIFLLLFITVCSNAQLVDTALIKKLSINGVCLCKTTLSALKQTYPDLKKVNVEEMDIPKGCFSEDSRFIAGVGYASPEQHGVIFQKDQVEDFVSKIRITNQFKGYLPNGKYIDMGTAKLKDIFRLYPELKDKWGSRGCSDYWNFSNDTISFYVKIDPSKKPQFPVDESFYMSKPIAGIDLTMSCYSMRKDQPNIVFPDESNDPVFFLDSIQVNKMVLSNYNPTEIASVTIYKDSLIIKKLYHKGAKNGLIYIETKDFAKNRYQNYFSSKSPEYASIIHSTKSNSGIQYILNGKILNKDYEGDLANLNDKTFREIKIIDKDQLTKLYGITDKNFGVLIYSVTQSK